MTRYLFAIILLLLSGSTVRAQDSGASAASKLFDKALEANFPNPDIPLAIKYYRKTIGQDSTLWGAYKNLGAIYVEQKKWAEADEILSLALRKLEEAGETDATVYLSRASAYLSQELWKQAIQDGEKALQLGMNDPYACEIIGNGYAALRRTYKSIDYYTRAISIYQQKGELEKMRTLYLKRGFEKAYYHDQIGAIMDWDRACKLHHEDACNLLSSESSYDFFLNEPSVIIQTIVGIASHASKLTEGKNDVLSYQAAINRYEDAIRCYDIFFDNISSEYEHNVILTVQDGGKISLNLPQHQQYLFLKLGRICYHAGDSMVQSDVNTAELFFQKGFDAYQRAFPFNGNDSLSQSEFFKGLLQWHYNFFDNIKKILSGIYTNRASKLDDEGEFEKALGFYARALELNPEYGDAHFERGLAYHRAQKHQKAVEDFTKALKFKTNSEARAYYFRADSYVKLKRYQDSAKDFEKAIELNPEYSTTKLVNWIKKYKQ